MKRNRISVLTVAAAALLMIGAGREDRGGRNDGDSRAHAGGEFRAAPAR